MPAASLKKYEVAVELLDRAIELYLRGDSFYSALHLGGAAEEVLAAYVREMPVTSKAVITPAFDQVSEAVVILASPESPSEKQDAKKWVYDRLSNAKNSVKHKRGSQDGTVKFDSKEEAYDVIDRAITNYIQLLSVLRLPHLSSIEKFDSHRRSESNR